MSITNKVTIGLVSLAFIVSLIAVGSATAAEECDDACYQAKIADLLEQIKNLQSSSSSSSRTAYSSSTTSTGSNAACSYTWTRNLSIGSTGDDVRQLQRFLNGNPQTQVAASGVGSPGNETSYYGPATARAVSKFQEMYAAQILTPLGLTKGTGGFYTSTRTQANKVCQSGTGSSSVSVNRAGTRSATTAAVVRVTGDALAVTPGNPISDSYVVLGAQRAPFTSVVLTAGTDDVRIQGIRIKRFGLSSSDNFDSIALVDANGVQVGSSRSLNSRDEVSLGSNFVVPANRSVTLAIVANMITDDADFNSGSIAGLEVAEVSANTRVQGTFPIRGAAHVLSSSVDLQKVEVEVGGGGGSVEFNESTEVASIDIDLSTVTAGGDDADKEDAYLRSIILEQVGSADIREIGDLEVFVDDETVNHVITVDRDHFIINFGGKGVLIEEGDDVEIVVETTTDRGYEETIQFAVGSPSDIYILGASYGYGLPVCFAGDDGSNTGGDTGGVACDGRQNGSETWKTKTNPTNKTLSAEISSGVVGSGSRLKRFEDEVRYGNDIILGALSVEFEGEDVLMEDLVFKVELDNYDWTSAEDNAWESAEEDTVRFDSVRLRVDGEDVAYANDSVDFDEPACAGRYSNDKACDDTTTPPASDDGRLTVEFDGSFTVDVREDREVIFEIVADLDEAWSHFEGTNVEFTLTDVGTAEGLNSERDYTATGEFFASDRDFEDVSIEGNEVTFTISDDGVDGESFVKGANSVVFGTLEIDAKGAIDDIEMRNLYVSFTVPADTGDTADTQKTGNLEHLDHCRILDAGGDEIADSRGVSGKNESVIPDPASAPTTYTQDALVTDRARFRFNSYVVEAGERERVDIVCDINDRATPADEYQIIVNSSATELRDQDRVEYRIGRSDEEKKLTNADNSSLITVDSHGILKIATANPDDNIALMAVATGRSGADNIAVLEIELEADKEDIEIVDVYLGLPGTLGGGTSLGSSHDAAGTTEGREALEKVFDRFTLKLGNTTADADDYTAEKTFTSTEYVNRATAGSGGVALADISSLRLVKFDGVNETVQDGDDNARKFDLTVDFNGIDKNDGVAGEFLTAAKLYVVWEGDDSGTTNLTVYPVASGGTIDGDVTKALAFPTVPIVSSTSGTGDEGSGKLYEFTVAADDEGDVYLGQVALKVDLDNGVTVAHTGADNDIEVRRGTSKSGKLVASVEIGSVDEIVFDAVEEIGAGESQVYSVWANTITPHATNNNQSIKVQLLVDNTNPGGASIGRTFDSLSIANFIWSPNTLDKDGSKASDNTDWFSGWGIFESFDVSRWTTDV